MTNPKQIETKKDFINYWSKYNEKEEDHTSLFWSKLLRIFFNVDDDNYIDYEKSVPTFQHTKESIDVYIPTTHTIIEQKKPGTNLDAKEYRPSIKEFGGWVTPYQQAAVYDSHLKYSEKARWIITCNFHEFRIYDMNDNPTDEKPTTTISIHNLNEFYYQLSPELVDPTKQDVKKETTLSIRACNIIDKIYHSLLNRYTNKNDPKNLRNVNKICVRLVFCLYADDSGIFGKHDMFHDYMQSVNTPMWNVMLQRLFNVLDTKVNDRKVDQLDSKIVKFPYVDGGLFTNDSVNRVEIPNFDENITELILNESYNFNWSHISPTIFGALFESTLNPKERNTNGMHYTSVKNIHKVIKPLFLTKLRNELSIMETRYKDIQDIVRLSKRFQNKLASLTFLDPACGSGNFLTETYLCLRKLENEAIKWRYNAIGTNKSFSKESIKVSINQFYGIEINDFAVSVAKTAMWIAESQMAQQTQNIIHKQFKLLPLRSNPNIIEANALEINWNNLINANKLNYIISNPPFIGDTRNKKQKQDMKDVLNGFKSIGRLDYVACWYKKTDNMIQLNHNIKAALVSTNSITQGVQVSSLWTPLLKDHINIIFAYQSFDWHNDSKDEAHVTCVIIGLSYQKAKHALLFNNRGIPTKVTNISPYLRALPNIIISRKDTPLCKVPKMQYGNKPTDKGFLSKYSTQKVKQITNEYPKAKKYFKRIVGAREFIQNKTRWCLWLYNTDKNWLHIPSIKNAVSKVATYRKNSKAKSTRTYPYPYLFRQIGQPTSDYLILPKTSSLKRKYIPIGFMNKNIIVTDKCFIIPKASYYLFGIIQSIVHMVWVDLVSGRMRNAGYEYTTKIVYNNFPWPTITDKQKHIISQTAQGILSARDNHKNEPLSNLYNPLSMPSDLLKAHHKNDNAVLKAYGLKSNASKNEISIKLLKMYSKLTNKASKY